MRTRSLALTTLVVLAVALAAGCGGGGGDRLSKADYIAQADAICKDANARLDKLPQPTTLDEVGSLAEQAIAIQKDAISKLRALKPPAEDEATLSKAYDLLDQSVAIGRQVADAAKAGDRTKIQELVASMDPINAQADKIAKDYGLVECGRN